MSWLPPAATSADKPIPRTPRTLKTFSTSTSVASRPRRKLNFSLRRLCNICGIRASVKYGRLSSTAPISLGFPLPKNGGCHSHNICDVLKLLFKSAASAEGEIIDSPEIVHSAAPRSGLLPWILSPTHGSTAPGFSMALTASWKLPLSSDAGNVGMYRTS